MSRHLNVAAMTLLMAATVPAVAQVATDVQCTACVGAEDLAANSVTTGEIENGAVKNADLGANSVTSGKIKDGNVNLADLSTDIQDLIGGSIANITLLGVTNTQTYIAQVVCPSDRLPVAASCTCDGGPTVNLGVLVGCTVTGDGAFAACQIDTASYDSELPSPKASVKGICLGATSADGTPWIPGPTAAGTDGGALGASSNASSAEIAAWRAAQHAELESKVAELKQRILRGRAVPAE